MKLFVYIKMNLALNNRQKFVCHKTQTNAQALNSNIFQTKQKCKLLVINFVKNLMIIYMLLKIWWIYTS